MPKTGFVFLSLILALAACTARPTASPTRASGKQRVRTYYVGPEEPANRALFDENFSGKAGELLPRLFPWSQLGAVTV